MNQPSSTRVSSLEKIVLIHVTVLLLFSSWAFGGNIGWARLSLSIWATFAPVLTVTACLQPGQRGRDARSKLPWLIPGVLYATLVILSAFNPSFDRVVSEGEVLMIHKGPSWPGWPSSVAPRASLVSLWFGAGVYLSAFNLAATLRARRLLRFIFIVIATNTLVLAVFGTIQKLSASGYYFGTVVSPNPRFFSTFIYNNHWGAFMMLGLFVSAGLLFYYARRQQGRDVWHSPLSAAIVGILIIAASAPVSASRAATAMAALLVAGGTAHALVKIAAARRRESRSAAPAIALLLALVLAATTAVGWLSLRSINERYTETRAALADNRSIWSGRLELYHDTVDLFWKKPAFGWGLDSYGIAFQLIRPRPLQTYRQYESSYATAHNDWLQSLAETGVVGTLLLLLGIILPLTGLPLRQLAHPLTTYPVCGLVMVLLYALIEFPFSSGAFLITFWILFFTTLKHAKLTESSISLRHE